MIGLLQGEVVFLVAPIACILTPSGVGYDVEMPLTSFCQLSFGLPTKMWTHLHVREDAQLLFGFIERREREVFRKLIKINGVGAKMALAMLSTMSVGELKLHVEQGNEAALTRIPGIGTKTAQRLLIELKDKLKDIDSAPLIATDLLDDGSDATSSVSQHDINLYNANQIEAEVTAALISLGYRDKEAQQAIKAAKSDKDSAFDDTQSLLKATLQQLSTF